MTYNQVERDMDLQIKEEERRIAAANQNSAVARIVNIVYFLFGLLELLLALRVILDVLGADMRNGFGNLVWSLSQPFVGLFEGLFRNPVIGNGVLELTTIIGMVAYAILAWIIARLIWLAFSRPR